jgi:hypothetical protein
LIWLSALLLVSVAASVAPRPAQTVDVHALPPGPLGTALGHATMGVPSAPDQTSVDSVAERPADPSTLGVSTPTALRVFWAFVAATFPTGDASSRPITDGASLREQRPTDQSGRLVIQLPPGRF